MAPVIPCCIGGNIALFPSTSFILRKPNHLTKCNFSTSPTGPTCCSQRFLLAYRISVQLFPKHRSGVLMQHGPKIQNLAAVGADLAVEEPNVVGDGEDKPIESSGAPTSGDASITPTEQSKRPRAVRKSEMPPIKTEELVPGATFTGKVRSIQPFGAFVDFGAFTDGLVHVSRMSDSFVKDVGSIVSVGQEVKVRILDANTETGRISLTMRDSDDISKLQQRKDASAGSNTDKPRPARRSTPKSNQRREDTQKSSKFYKGQVLDGTVKNLTRAGAFISLPEGEEGFLPTSEESEAFGSILGSSGLQVGQEVNVRVLRVSRGQVTLTMKKEEDVKELNMKLNQGVVHTATNPFELAFRRNKVIAAFLEERETAQKLIEAKQIQAKAKEIVTRSEIPEPRAETITQEQLVDTSTKLEIPQNEAEKGKTTKSEIEGMLDSTSEEVKVDEKDLDSAFSKTESTEVVSEISSLEQVFSTEIAEEPMIANEKSEKETSVEITQEEEASSTSLVSEENISCVSLVINKSLVTEEVGGDSNETQLIEDTPNQILSSQEVVHAGTAEGAREVDTKLVNDKVVTELSVAAENEMATTTLKEDIKAIPIPEKNVSISSSGLEQTEILSPPESTIKATISPALVKQLREETGAGMMDCKKALAETGGDIVRAQEFLRKKGLASAEKKASRATAEGRVGSYVHDNRIGVLIEINCETDFVSRGDIFKQLVEDLAMQVAACPQVRYLVTEDVPEEIVNKEKEIEMQKEDLLNKPEQIRSKIVEGRISKRLSELALLEQPYIKNDKVVVKDWVKQTVATVGENIKVIRFVRYNLGEGLEKKSQDFATEVAAQTAAKPSTAVATDQSTTENKEASEKPAAVAVAVSAALVKQLREETGAGMMDCKKALMETGGDLEKAQEYLRKKGLSSADKKSSRLAAEGRISSYIHDSRIGVLIEVNCETDFVGRSEKFKQLVDDLAMQVVACPRVEYVSVEEIPEGIKNKEKELEMQREDLSSKPENIREKIVDGRVAKRLGELALLEQPFIRDDSVLVKDLVKQTVAALGENIKVRRFVRFTLGEGMESTKIEG